MALVSRSLKLPFLRLNQSKAAEFLRLQTLNTKLANKVLSIPKAERNNLTTASFKDVEIGSAWINQTIRNANAKTKVKQFQCMPLETNNQNWTLHKVGETYSVSFGILRGIKKRVPLAVHEASHASYLDAVIAGTAKPGSIKLFRSRRGIWYALLSVSMEVPDAREVTSWIGVDRGQNIPAVAALPNGGRLFFFKAGRIKHIRGIYSKRRKVLQAAGKHRAVKKLDKHESRIVIHINHKISKEIVGLAARTGHGIRLEDLSGIRQNTRQRKTTKSDAGLNRDTWPFFQLETFIAYKAIHVQVPIEKIPAPYTSKTHHTCGHLGKRSGFDFFCSYCNKHEHADGNAARNIGGWVGLFCAWEPSTGSPVISDSALRYGVYGSPQNSVSDTSGNPLV